MTKYMTSKLSQNHPFYFFVVAAHLDVTIFYVRPGTFLFWYSFIREEKKQERPHYKSCKYNSIDVWIAKGYKFTAKPTTGTFSRTFLLHAISRSMQNENVEKKLKSSIIKAFFMLFFSSTWFYMILFFSFFFHSFVLHK